MPVGIYKRKPFTKKHKENISRSLIDHKHSKSRKIKECKHLFGNQYALGYRHTKKTKRKIGDKAKIYQIGNRNSLGHQVSDLQIEIATRNGFGTKCHSDDGLFFPSLQERDCYYWARDDVDEVENVKKFGRIDFILTLINEEKVALEYHPCTFLDGKTYNQYYSNRRKLLDELGYKDLKLIVMTSLKEEEKERVKEYLLEVLK